MSEFVFIASNVGIFLSYVFVALFIVPRANVRLARTRVGGVGFFLLCGLHHLENVFHLAFQGREPVEAVLTSPHMLVIDGLQVICVWLFVSGLYLEMARYGPWHAGPDVVIPIGEAPPAPARYRSYAELRSDPPTEPTTPTP